MRTTELTVTVTARTSELTAALDRLSANIEAIRLEIGLALAPVLENMAAILRAWYESYPGMPYTAPSRWDPDQMRADR